jgi:hypothetical protein
MTEPNKVIRIEVEYADGSVEWATGDDAHRIWSGLMNGLVIAHQHGSIYFGPKLTRKESGANPAPIQNP